MGTIEKQVAVTLVSVIFLAIFGVGYVLVEPTWRAERGKGMTEHSARMGAELFQTQECFKCHGQNGFGTLDGSGPGWPLNTTQNQRGSATELENRRQLLYRTIDRGRGTVMPALGRENGGPLNSEQINNLVDYVQYGHWPVPPVEGEAATLAQGGAAAAGGGSRGAQLFASNGCSGCHQVKGQGGAIGPSLNTIGTTAATRKPGMSAEEYIRESLVNPSAFVVSGFQAGVMPAFSQLSAEDQKALIDYLLEQK